MLQYQKEEISQLQLDILLFLYIACPHQRDGVTLYSSWLDNPSFIAAFHLDSVARRRKIQFVMRRLLEKGLVTGYYRTLDGKLHELIPLSSSWEEDAWIERLVLTSVGEKLALDFANNSELCHKFDEFVPQIEHQELRHRPKSLLVFLHALFGDAGETAGNIVISTIHHNFVSKIPVNEIQQAAQTVWQLADQHDVFISAGLQKEEKNPDDTTTLKVSALPGVWLDIELDIESQSQGKQPDSIEPVLDWINRYPLKPSLIVDTGFGIQAYWLLDEPWVLETSEERIRARELMRNFQCALGKYLMDQEWDLSADRDLFHNLRLPGTYNREQAVPALVYIIEFFENRRYSLLELEESLLLEPQPEEKPSIPLLDENLEDAQVEMNEAHQVVSLDEAQVVRYPIAPARRSRIAEALAALESEFLPNFIDSAERVSASPPEFINTSEALIQLAHEFELFHTPDEVRYASVPIKGYKEYYPLHSKMFRNVLSYRFYQQSAKTPSTKALDDAVGYLEIKEQTEGHEAEVFHRVARIGNTIYLDLANPTGDVVKIDPDGWEVVQNAPVHFLRPRGILPLPSPEWGCSIGRLRPFLNVDSDEDFHLIVGWILESFRMGTAKPILNIQGEQGSGKSLLSRVLCALIDPTVDALQSPVKHEREMATVVRRKWVLAYDNVSTIPQWMSDSLCRISMGFGRLNEETTPDNEEFSLRLGRPVIINGIEQCVTREDLLDRLIVVIMPSIAEATRRDEREFWQDFSLECPAILGAICDGLSAALRNEDRIRLSTKPRMADFAKWVSAAEEGLNWPAGTFSRTYQKNINNVVEQTLENDFIATAIIDFMKDHSHWEGSAQSLLSELEPHIPEKIKKSRMWPSSPLSISNSIRRSSNFLRMVGIQIQKPEKPTWDQLEKKAKRVFVISRNSIAS